MSPQPHFLDPLLRADAGATQMVNERTGSVVAHTLELAADSRARNKGLLGRTNLAPATALIIAPCNAIHTFFMRFTIDVVFANRQGMVVGLRPHLKPWRIAILPGAFAAVEMAAGSIEGDGIRIGDRLAIHSDLPRQAGLS